MLRNLLRLHGAPRGLSGHHTPIRDVIFKAGHAHQQVFLHIRANRFGFMLIIKIATMLIYYSSCDISNICNCGIFFTCMRWCSWSSGMSLQIRDINTYCLKNRFNIPNHTESWTSRSKTIYSIYFCKRAIKIRFYVTKSVRFHVVGVVLLVYHQLNYGMPLTGGCINNLIHYVKDHLKLQFTEAMRSIFFAHTTVPIFSKEMRKRAWCSSVLRATWCV